MTWPIYALIIVFAAFIIILAINPNLSCFGRRVKSPFYPLLRKKRRARKIDVKSRLREAEQRSKTGAAEPSAEEGRSPQAKDKTDDYGFHLD